MKTTPPQFLSLLAPGAQVIVRDEARLVRSIGVRASTGWLDANAWETRRTDRWTPDELAATARDRGDNT